MTRTTLGRSALAIALLFSLPQCTPSADATVSIMLTVDASEAPRKILHTHEVIPVRPGALTLLYPKWIPGEHGPTGPVIDVAGIRITAGGAMPFRGAVISRRCSPSTARCPPARPAWTSRSIFFCLPT